jgi:predicted nucleic acid-binding protein
MAMFPAFLDTNCLFGGYLCDVMLRLAEVGTYRPLWSADIFEELKRNLLKRGLSPGQVGYRLAEMSASFPDAEVRGYETLVEAMTCDKKDRHVLAAAVRGRARVIVTFNVSDFPADSLDQYDITVISPDEFLLDQLDLYPGHTVAVLRAQASDYDSPAMSVEELLGRLAAAGVPRFASEARRHLQGSNDYDVTATT